MNNALIEAAKEVSKRTGMNYQEALYNLSKIWNDLTSHKVMPVRSTPGRKLVQIGIPVVTAVKEESLDDFCF